MTTRWMHALLLALAAPCAAMAAVIEVAPVSHELAPGQQALSMTVTNRADSGVSLQVRGFAWTQDDGQDRLLPAADVLVAPAIFSLAPGQSQVLRAALRAPATLREGSYRLLIDELPMAGETGQVRMALRLSIPVFVPGSARAPARLAWQIDAAGRAVVVSHQGGQRERVHELALVTASGQRVPASPDGGPYVLAGAQRRWALPVGPATLRPGEAVTLVALTDAGRVEVPLVVAP